MIPPIPCCSSSPPCIVPLISSLDPASCRHIMNPSMYCNSSCLLLQSSPLATTLYQRLMYVPSLLSLPLLPFLASSLYLLDICSHPLLPLFPSSLMFKLNNFSHSANCGTWKPLKLDNVFKVSRYQQYLNKEESE